MQSEDGFRAQADRRRFWIFVLVYLAFVSTAIATGPAGGDLNGAGMACAILLTLPWFYLIGLLMPSGLDLPLALLLALCSVLNVFVAILGWRIRARRLSQSLRATPQNHG